MDQQVDVNLVITNGKFFMGWNIENTMLVPFDIKLSGETRNSVGMARVAQPV